MYSHGRGGAGNIAPSASPSHDLATPTLKTAVVTTGRGGTGNMAPNLDPVETRMRQDVEPVPRRYTARSHWGRGGAGNVFSDTGDDDNLCDDDACTDDELSRTASAAPSTASGKMAALGKSWLRALGR